jgi:diguanylate cyclase (GGDEF)-like protein/PAS domain S-box-containing protein
LDESRRIFSRVVEQSPVLIVVTNHQGDIENVNPKFEQLTGYSSAEILGKNPRVLSSGEIPANEYRDLWATVTSGSTWYGEFHNRRKDGTIFWDRASISPIGEERSRLIHIAAVKEGITERRLFEQELRIASTAFEVQEGVVITDDQSVTLGVNQSLSFITGCCSDEVVGKTPSGFSSGRHGKAFFGAMWASLLSSGSWPGEIWNLRKNGGVSPGWLSITAVKNVAGVITHYAGSITNITLRKKAEDELNNLAFYDPLTRLPKRRLLIERLQQATTTSTRNKCDGALLFIDLDNFKTLNDTLGHEMGDLLLQQVAQRLSKCVRNGDTVARLRGDEFVVLLKDLSQSSIEAAGQAEMVGENILGALNETYSLGEHKHHSMPSIGLTLFKAHPGSAEELMRQADLAMYRAKAAARNTLRFFDPVMQAVVVAKAALEAGLRKDITNDQFLVYYQPQVDILGRVIGAEALVRGVLDTACRQLVAWANRPEAAHLSLSVNVSARLFRLPNLVEQILEMLAHTGAPAERLKLELTESMLLKNPEDIILMMLALKASRIGFSMDDFCTGYSSLSYLRRSPLDQLKIDQSFVRDVLTDPDAAVIAKAIVALAQRPWSECHRGGRRNGIAARFHGQRRLPRVPGVFVWPSGPGRRFSYFLNSVENSKA